MVLDLLELARLDSGVASFNREPLDLGRLLKDVVEKFTPQASQSNIDLRYNLRRLHVDTISANSQDEDQAGVDERSELLPAVIGDPDRLAQVFTNLVDNALKYTPTNGSVDVNARCLDGFIEVQIADTGPGIPAEELDRVFERFYQMDKSRRGGERRGVGLGLAIAHEIVQAHGGTIKASSKQTGSRVMETDHEGIGIGSVFQVRIPVAGHDDETLVRRN
jgi:signal transduction histidine kinase